MKHCTALLVLPLLLFAAGCPAEGPPAKTVTDGHVHDASPTPAPAAGALVPDSVALHESARKALADGEKV